MHCWQYLIFDTHLQNRVQSKYQLILHCFLWERRFIFDSTLTPCNMKAWATNTRYAAWNRARVSLYRVSTAKHNPQTKRKPIKRRWVRVYSSLYLNHETCITNISQIFVTYRNELCYSAEFTPYRNIVLNIGICHHKSLLCYTGCVSNVLRSYPSYLKIPINVYTKKVKVTGFFKFLVFIRTTESVLTNLHQTCILKLGVYTRRKIYEIVLINSNFGQ